jgi:serine phosphatase RsbU (regulator of sigma subunit)
MAASKDFDATLQEVATATVPEMADWCMLTLLEADGRLSTAAIAHADPSFTERGWEVMRRHPPQPGDPAGPARVIRTGEAEHLPELDDGMLAGIAADEEHLMLLRRLGLRSSLVVPLRQPGRVLGALTLLFAESRRRFGEDEVSLARALAARASLYIHNARLHDELAHIASTLQRSLLPQSLPDVPHLDIATRYLPVGEQNEVGGDFYDLFETGPGVWTALIGDVSGKGAEAAAITALARHTLRAAAMRDPDPVENLAPAQRDHAGRQEHPVLHRVLRRLRPSPGELRVTLANGGHMPPLVVRADGTVEHVEVPARSSARCRRAVLVARDPPRDPGELLLLYTDGVTDLRTRGPRSGERQLAQTLERVAGAGVEETLDAVTTMAVEAQDGNPA